MEARPFSLVAENGQRVANEAACSGGHLPSGHARTACTGEQAVEAPYPGDEAVSHVLWKLLVLLQLLQEDASGEETNASHERC